MLPQLTPQIIVAAQGINTAGITNFILSTIVPILLGGIGVLIILGSKKGRLGEVFGTLSIVIVGLVVIGGAAAFRAFGNELTNLIFN